MFRGSFISLVAILAGGNCCLGQFSVVSPADYTQPFLGQGVYDLTAVYGQESAAWAEDHRAYSELNMTIIRLQREFTHSPQYKAAAQEVDDAQAALDAARRPVLAAVAGDPHYQELHAKWQNVADVLAEGGLPAPDMLQLAARKMDYGSEMQKMEAAALSSDPAVANARARLAPLHRLPSPHAHADLRRFLKLLESEGELTCASNPRSIPSSKSAEIADRISKTPAPHGHSEPDRSPAAALGGKALLFESVAGSDIPVAINTFGSYWRVNQALGSANSLQELADRIAATRQAGNADDAHGEDEEAARADEAGQLSAQVVRSGICQQVVLEGDKADLNRLPIIQCWPLDGDLDQRAGLRPRRRCPPNRARLRPLHHLRRHPHRDPDTGDRNIGMYRVQVFGPRRAPCTGTCTTTAPATSGKYQAQGEKMPLAIALGGESVLPYAATAPLPPGIEELSPRRLPQRRRHRTRPMPHHRPAGAGQRRNRHRRLRRSDRKTHGRPVRRSHRLLFAGRLVSGLSRHRHHARRKNPIYPTTIVGKPPMEDYFSAKPPSASSCRCCACSSPTSRLQPPHQPACSTIAPT
jgi:4-hydroxy-3-polyprenylbenzoate decarboxylase